MAHRRLDWKVALALGVAGVWLGRRLTRRRYDLRGKTVLICGGARGFGLALARAFGARGGRLALLADDGAELAHAASELRLEGIEAWVFPCDVRLSDQVQRALREVVEALGPIDVLVNNAGATALEPREAMLLSDYQEAMDAHFFAPLSLVQAVLPAMRARGEGRIVNIASPGGKVPSPHRLPDVASKFALVGFSEGLHAEVKQDGIVVTTVCPGGMERENASEDPRRESDWFEVLASLPSLRIGADAAARAIVRACELGKAELILSGPAKTAARVHGIAPGLTSEALAWVSRRRPRNSRAEQSTAGPETGAGPAPARPAMGSATPPPARVGTERGHDG